METETWCFSAVVVQQWPRFARGERVTAATAGNDCNPEHPHSRFSTVRPSHCIVYTCSLPGTLRTLWGLWTAPGLPAPGFVWRWAMGSPEREEEAEGGEIEGKEGLGAGPRVGVKSAASDDGAQATAVCPEAGGPGPGLAPEMLGRSILSPRCWTNPGITPLTTPPLYRTLFWTI